MHLKRRKSPKSWPIGKKGFKFIVGTNLNKKDSIPVLILLRDVLKFAQNRKEVKKSIYQGFILVNGKRIRDEKKSLVLFDTLSIIPMKKYYRLDIGNKGKFKLEEINEKASLEKISKIKNKKILKKKKIQINLIDGRNILSDLKCNVSDSLILDLKEKKIKECIPLKEKSKVKIFSGKHSGKLGIIKNLSSDKKIAEIDFEGEKINALTKQIIAIK